MQKIQVQELTKIFGKHPKRALKLIDEGVDKSEIFNKTGQAVGLANVSFDVEEGEILVVMGLSGSGKSTLVRCINRLIEPTQGKVFIDGQDVRELNHHDLRHLRRSKFGMVFQHFALFPHRTILMNTEYGLEIQGVKKAEREEKARNALKLVGLEGWEEAMPHQLSGGMQQRVGLARALAVEPDILLMDEAFSALDPLIRRDMQHELISLQERVHKTIIFITHDLDEALKIGDRIVLMKGGSVVQIGTPEEILTSPANDYVERFVENVDKSKVLSARTVLAKAKVVAFPNDGPRTVLHKMQEEALSNILVVKRDYTLEGIIFAEDASEAAQRGDKTIEAVIQRDIPKVSPDETLTTLISIISDKEWVSAPIPVIDENQKLLGIVVKGSILSGLAQSPTTTVNNRETV